MKIGTEDKKKVGALIVLGLGALYGMYSAFSGPSGAVSTPAPAPAARDRAAVDLPAIPAAPEPAAPPRAPARTTGRAEEFHPVLHSKSKDNPIDPTTIDPDIKLYLLAKLQAVAPAGGGRNLFQFGAQPPKELPKGPEPTVKVARLIGPPLIQSESAAARAGAAPAAPPAPFDAKYYGLATSAANGRKRAFFLHGEDILIKAEGETVEGHFRVVRIGVTSVVVEDTESKRQQTVQITEEMQG
jgi:hypothetical protein